MGELAVVLLVNTTTKEKSATFEEMIFSIADYPLPNHFQPYLLTVDVSDGLKALADPLIELYSISWPLFAKLASAKCINIDGCSQTFSATAVIFFIERISYWLLHQHFSFINTLLKLIHK